MSAAQVVNEYLAAYTSGDVERAASLVSDDFRFRGPMTETVGRDTFAGMARHVAPHARGHQMLRQWSDGDEVCSLYRFDVEPPTGATSVLVSEWNTVRDARVCSSVMIFDTAPFQAASTARDATVDPVCGMSVEPDTAAAHRTHDRRDYYFCSTGCAERFDRDPARYASAVTPA